MPCAGQTSWRWKHHLLSNSYGHCCRSPEDDCRSEFCHSASLLKCSCHCSAHSQHMCNSEENIKLTCTYPRKDLMSEGDSQTLAQVGLAPTGVVIARLGKVQYRVEKLSESCIAKKVGCWCYFKYKHAMPHNILWCSICLWM